MHIMNEKAGLHVNLITYAKDLSLIKKSALNNCTQEKRKVTNLMHVKRKFELVVRLIANRCYQDVFQFINFLPIIITTHRYIRLCKFSWSPP